MGKQTVPCTGLQTNIWPRVQVLIQLLAILLLVTTTRPGFASSHPHSVAYRLILPHNYVGWVRIDFSVKSAGELDVSDENVATVVIQENGTAQTSSTYVSGARERYLLFYTENDRLTRVPKSLYSSRFMLDGFGRTQYSTSGEPVASSWYFLIGPKSLRRKNPTKIFLQPGATPPVPGRITPP